MFGSDDSASARRLPAWDANDVAVKQEESDIVRLARAYDEARHHLSHLREERDRIDEGIKDCMARMDEAALHMVSIIQPTAKASSR